MQSRAIGIVGKLVVGLMLLSGSAIGLASSPGEKLVCTQLARQTWLSEAKIREIFGPREYSLVKFKVSSGNCYEFYAIHLDGSIVEAYYHPVTGEILRYNRIVANGSGMTH